MTRTMRRRVPKSSSRSARTTCARLDAFSAVATESSRSRHTASAWLAAAFAIMSGREPGTNNVLLIVFLVPVLLTLMRRLQRGQEQRAALLQAALDASDTERRRIAGTLHDGVVQELAATSFSLAGGAQRAESMGRTDEACRLVDASEAVRGNIASLRSLLVGAAQDTPAGK